MGEKPAELSDNHIQLRTIKDFTDFIADL
jgi:hypothetical protein